MKKKLAVLLIITLVVCLIPTGVFASSSSASHDKVTYYSSNVSNITYDKYGCYVTTKASFKWNTAPKASKGKDVLTHSISSGFLMTSASGSVTMTPQSVTVYGVVNRIGRGGTTYKTISLTNTKELKKYLKDADIKKIKNSAYQQKLSVIEKDNGKTYALFNSKGSKTNICKSKTNKTVRVNYEGRSGYYTVKWRTPTKTKVYNYNLYTNYGYNRLGLTPKVSFKGWDVQFNNTIVKGKNAILRISQRK